MSYDGRVSLIVERIRYASGTSFTVEVADNSEAIDHADMDGHKITLARNSPGNYSDDELAAAISHEVAHIENQDHVREAQRIQELRDQATQRVAEVLNEHEQGEGGFWRGLLTAVRCVGAGTHYLIERRAVPRYHEMEADDRAIEIMIKAGFNHEGMKSLLKKKYAPAGSSGEWIDHVGWDASHPALNERLANVDAAVAKYK